MSTLPRSKSVWWRIGTSSTARRRDFSRQPCRRVAGAVLVAVGEKDTELVAADARDTIALADAVGKQLGDVD